MSKALLVLGAVASLCAGLVGTGPVWAEDGFGSAIVQKRVEGVMYTLPADWPIERRDGITGPIPVEQYLGRKFDALDERLKLIEQRISGFDLRLRILEQGDAVPSSVGSGQLRSIERREP